MEAHSLDVDSAARILDGVPATRILIDGIGEGLDVHLLAFLDRFSSSFRLVNVRQTLEGRDSDQRGVAGKVGVEESLVREDLGGRIVDVQVGRELVNR